MHDAVTEQSSIDSANQSGANLRIAAGVVVVLTPQLI
jgi:hypothetical protein